VFSQKSVKILKEKSLQINSKAQNNYCHVKIGFKILTTIVTKIAFNKKIAKGLFRERTVPFNIY
jgi:undecaprenyl pyrophosphate phosphatase UppP